MRKIIRIAVLLSVLFTVGSLNADNTDPTMDKLIVHGKNFAFAVKEPKGWLGDIDNAYRFKANIIFYPKNKVRPDTIVRIRVNQKVDENTAEDLKYDMEQYRKKFEDIQFRDLNVSNRVHEVFPKLFYMPDKFYAYVTYINPGLGKKMIFSVAMNIQKRVATEEEFKAYSAIVESIWLMTENVKMK